MALRPRLQLRQAALAVVDLDDADAGANIGFQRLVIGDAGVNKHHFELAAIERRISLAHAGVGIGDGVGAVRHDGGS